MTQVIAHRGASAVAPENTVEAFRTAVELGADGVELDVRRSTAGHLAVCHDEVLPDGRALFGLDRRDWPETLCELSAALDACAGLAVVNVEIKNWPGDGDYDADLAIADAVVAALLTRPATEQGAFLVSCFDLATLDRVRDAAPGLATGWLTIGFGDVEKDLERLAERGHAAVHPHHSAVDADVVAAAHARGLAVNTWTCDLPDRIRWLAEAGVDGVVTNDVTAALTALDRAGTPGPAGA